MNSNVILDSYKGIPDQMIWREAAIQQIEQFRLFTETLGSPWDVVGHHTSKSIQLPVICIVCGDMKVYLRDNFHDINLCVVSEKPITTPMSVLFDGVLEPLSWDWYLAQVAKCRGYSWREWTDEQMDTPGLLTFSNDAVPSYMAKQPSQKARWIHRMTSPAWYREDWSSNTIVWEGEDGPGATLWVQSHPFMQGIETLVPKSASQPYKPGCCGFALALPSLDDARKLMMKLIAWSSEGLEEGITHD
jgi:hypothetical protein